MPSFEKEKIVEMLKQIKEDRDLREEFANLILELVKKDVASLASTISSIVYEEFGEHLERELSTRGL